MPRTSPEHRGNSRAEPVVIQSKLRVPPAADGVIPRPRVSSRLAEHLARHRAVWVCATAGAGKTTAVVEAATRLEVPLAWLTLDATDAAPGRLLTYLEACLARQVPTAAGVATNALALRIPHAEAAGVLAEAATGSSLLVVIDELERIADAKEALAVIAAFVRYAPPCMHIALISRVEVALDLGSSGQPTRVVTVGESELAFTTEEAGEALASAGRIDIDPAAAVDATGGWVTGVLFEAWRSADHVLGMGGEADPLHGYLATQILSQLEPAERDFLVTTSLLDEVTPRRAEALGLAAAGDRLAALRTKHLPVTWVPSSTHMRSHPRFREYLLERLARRGAGELRALREAYGTLLAAENHHEEAVEQFLASGASDRALDSADEAIGQVIERLDFDVAERWLSTLAAKEERAPIRLAVPELMLAIGGEQYSRAARVADRLLAAGEREELARRSALAASMMGWAYWHVGRIEDARAVFAVGEDSPQVAAVGYLLRLVHHDPDTEAPPPLVGGPLDALVMRVNYAHGRLRELAMPPASDWAAAVTAPWRIGALRAMGRTEQALELYHATDIADWSAAWLHGIVAPEIMIDLGHAEEARSAIAHGRSLIRESGSVVFDMLNRLIEAKLHLRLGGDAAAAELVLSALEELSHTRRYEFISEQLDLWMGMSLLLQARDAEALERLDRAVASMVAADRILELPTAAVLLAEARWRVNDEDGSDRAADLALSAARRQGFNHHLLQALADFPAVVARRLDAERAADSPWHELGRALRAQGVDTGAELGTHLRMVEFGRMAIFVDGEEVRPRISKSYELLAFLAGTPARSAEREELLDALFEGRADASARSYLRQAVHRLREALPPGAGPVFEGSTLHFGDDVSVTGQLAHVEVLLAEASRQQGAERLGPLIEALEIADGPYLPGVRGSWAARRREQVAELLDEARLDAAQLAFAANRYQDAERLVSRVLRDAPFRESAWRLTMRVAAALGDEDGVISAYRACQLALKELGTEPSASTRELLTRLRR
jgi:LuxR family maltose regulon positive regulatory protein